MTVDGALTIADGGDDEDFAELGIILIVWLMLNEDKRH